MTAVNAIEMNGALFFIGEMPEEKIMEVICRYDERFCNAKVLSHEKEREVRRALTIRSAQACNYRLS